MKVKVINNKVILTCKNQKEFDDIKDVLLYHQGSNVGIYSDENYGGYTQAVGFDKIDNNGIPMDEDILEVRVCIR